MALVAETAVRLRARGVKLRAFVSPNVATADPDNNRKVFDEYMEKLVSRLK
jgi:uncharacterized phosphosugar-binding protein